MKTRVWSGIAVLAVALLTMTGCAGVSKDVSGHPAAQPVPAAQTTQTAPVTQTATAQPVSTEQAVSATELTISAIGELPAGTSIGAVDLVLRLPAGVEVKADKSGETLPGIVVASGVAKGSLTVSKYTPADGAAPATLRSAFIMREGFGIGEFATVHFVSSESALKASDFSLLKLAVSNVDGQKLTGIKGIVTLKAKSSQH
jgi:hypothetical protein